MRGHFHANLEPLGIEAPRNREELDPRSYGFVEGDFDRKIFLDHVLGMEYATLREIVAICERTYCQTLGVEFMHISNPAQKGWIQERIEGPDKEISFTREGRRAILTKLVEAEGFEKFCDTKFTGTKRFGLDGAESLIPADRKSTRLNSSHRCISYAVFCLKKKKIHKTAKITKHPEREQACKA